jgi:7-keto-8-aminopelargonate synthetase-like enzyme
MPTNENRTARLEKQRLRSARNRARRKDEGKPSHEDLARAVLDIAFTRYLGQGRHGDLMRILDQVADRLAELGFTRNATETVWLDLEDRYEHGWSMLRRRTAHARVEADGRDIE